VTNERCADPHGTGPAGHGAAAARITAELRDELDRAFLGDDPNPMVVGDLVGSVDYPLIGAFTTSLTDDSTGIGRSQNVGLASGGLLHVLRHRLRSHGVAQRPRIDTVAGIGAAGELLGGTRRARRRTTG
jgi:hypothetical protein